MRLTNKLAIRLDYHTNKQHYLTTDMKTPVKHESAMHWRDPELTMTLSYADHKLRSYPVHDHNFAELVIITEGEGIQFVNNIEYPISAGDVFVIQGEQTHGYKYLNNAFHWNVAFDTATALSGHDSLRQIPGYIALFTLEPYKRGSEPFKNRLKLDAGGLNWVSALVQRMHDEQEGKRPGWREMCRSLLAELVIFLSRKYEGIPVTQQDDARIQAIGRIISLMEERKAEELTLPFLAAKANMSVNTFLRVFKAMTGSSPVDYLIGIRIQAAKKLLQDTRMSVGEIAMECGFQDSNYFTRRFRKATVISPLGYRRRKINCHE